MKFKRPRLPLLGAFALVGLAAWWLWPGPVAPEGPLPDQLAWLVETAHRERGFSGTILITRGEQTLYEQSMGLADVARDVPNAADTRFLLASVSKPVTAVLVWQLIEAGKLRGDSTLESLFPKLRGTAAGGVTIHQLLTHTSGIEETIGRHPLQRIVPEELASARIESPGKFAYSSTGYVCLALAIEDVTQLTFEQAVEQMIFEPAGMRDSGVARSQHPVQGLAVGYVAKQGQQIPAERGFAFEAVDGAGSLYSTARDLRRFIAALHTGELLSPETRDLMLQPQVPGRFASGWFLGEQGGKYFPWHSGDFPGCETSLVWQIHRDEVIVILGNSQGSDIDRLRKESLRLLKLKP